MILANFLRQLNRLIGRVFDTMLGDLPCFSIGITLVVFQKIEKNSRTIMLFITIATNTNAVFYTLGNRSSPGIFLLRRVHEIEAIFLTSVNRN